MDEIGRAVRVGTPIEVRPQPRGVPEGERGASRVDGETGRWSMAGDALAFTRIRVARRVPAHSTPGR
jgi:hypothetical protein